MSASGKLRCSVDDRSEGRLWAVSRRIGAGVSWQNRSAWNVDVYACSADISIIRTGVIVQSWILQAMRYSLAQADAILKKWHEESHDGSSRYGPKEVVTFAETILMVDAEFLPETFVRDLCKKYTKNTKRKAPEGWKGILSMTDSKEKNDA